MHKTKAATGLKPFFNWPSEFIRIIDFGMQYHFTKLPSSKKLLNTIPPPCFIWLNLIGKWIFTILLNCTFQNTKLLLVLPISLLNAWLNWRVSEQKRRRQQVFIKIFYLDFPNSTNNWWLTAWRALPIPLGF